MSSALRILEGDFGRINLIEASTPLAPHAHAEHLVLVKYSGADSRYRVGGMLVPFTREDIVFVNALELHDNARRRDAASTLLLATYLDADWLRGLSPHLFSGDQPPFPRHRERITPHIRRRCDTLAAEMMHGADVDKVRLQVLVLDLLVSIVDCYLSRGRRGADAWLGSRFADHRIRRAIGLLRANPKKDIRIAGLASEVGLSRSRFYDLFQACTGVPPQTYLDMLCTERAIARLTGSNAEVAAIARELGFTTGGNFARFFVRQIGIVPNEYRRVTTQIAQPAAVRR